MPQLSASIPLILPILLKHRESVPQTFPITASSVKIEDMQGLEEKPRKNSYQGGIIDPRWGISIASWLPIGAETVV
jgi:hypothetical protein